MLPETRCPAANSPRRLRAEKRRSRVEHVATEVVVVHPRREPARDEVRVLHDVLRRVEHADGEPPSLPLDEEVGGTHPALIEAMGAGNCALTLKTPENLEVMGDAGIIYDSVSDLTRQLQRVINDPSMIVEYRRRAMARVIQFYNWEQITDQYEELLARLTGVEIPVNQPISTEPVTYPIFIEEPAPKVRRAANTIP